MPDFPLIETIRVPTLSLFLIDERNSTRDVQIASADIMQATLVDLVLGDQRTLALQMHEYLGKDVHKFEVVDIDLPVRKRHVAASRAIAGEDKMIAAFNRALAEVRKDGSHAAIVAKWDKRYSIE